MTEAFAFLKRTQSGATVTLRVQPRARKNALELAGGNLKVSVSTPPVDGRANDAVVAVLAESWRLPKSSFALVKGQSARTKTFAVAGDPALIAQRISDWMTKSG